MRRIVYVGTGGEFWDLTGDGDKGQVTALETSEGFFHAPKTTLAFEDAYSPGSRAGSTKYAARRFTLQVLHSHREHGRERQWWRSWSTDKDGELRISSPVDGTRTLKVRLDKEPTYEDVREPKGTYQVDTLPLVALSPFYRGAPHIREFTFTRAGTERIEFVNAGDVPAWPVFSADSGSWVFPDGIAGDTVPVHGMPRPFTAVSQLGVETLHDRVGLPMYEHLRWKDFTRPIPPGTRIKLPVQASQAGKLRVSIEQHFERPWA